MSGAETRPPPNEKDDVCLAKLVESALQLVVGIRENPRLHSNTPPKKTRPERCSPAKADRQHPVVKLNAVPFHIQSTGGQSQDPTATLSPRLKRRSNPKVKTLCSDSGVSALQESVLRQKFLLS